MIIDEKILYELYRERTWYKGTDFKLIKDTITGSDVEDGGADHDVIIQDVTTGKYYEGSYTDWDVDYNFHVDKDGNVIRCDFDNDLCEVVPKEVTTIIYERIK